jgi:hypothetical protein
MDRDLGLGVLMMRAIYKVLVNSRVSIVLVVRKSRPEIRRSGASNGAA